MAQNYTWPVQSSSNASVGANGGTAPTSSTEVSGINSSGNLQPLQTDSSGNLKVVVESGSTTNQNVNLADVGGSPIALGQATMAASLPVVIASNQSTLPISAASLPLPAGASTSALQSSILTALGSPFQAGGSIGNTSFGISGSLPAGSNAIGSVSVSNFPATQPVSGTVTVIQPTAANLNATVVGTVTANAGSGTFAISASSLPLPTGAATSANQTTMITDLGQISTNTAGIAPGSSGSGQYGYLQFGVTSTLEPAYSAGLVEPLSLDLGGALRVNGSGVTQPVSGNVTVSQATASNLNATVVNTGTFAVQAAQSGTWNINNISGTVSLPTGAATSALQSTISGQLPASLGQKASAASLAVVIASDQSAIAVKPSEGTLTDGSGSTSSTANTSTQIFAANSSRKYLLIQNLSSSANIFINFTSSASSAAGSYVLEPYGSLVQEASFVSTEAVNVASSTASVPFTAKQG